MTADTSFSIAILAGGKSSRMGDNKALLPVGEVSLIEHVIHTAQAMSPADLLLVTNTPANYVHLNQRMVADTIPHQGAISGILSALHYSLHDTVIVIACDLPFVQSTLLSLLLATLKQRECRAVVPMLKGYPQPVLAVYHRDCLAHFQQCIDKGQRKLQQVLDRLDYVHYMTEDDWQTIDPQGISFINVNTPQDLNDARKLWKNWNDADE